MDFRSVLSSFPPVMLALLIPASALAQGAWVPKKGEAVFSISYQWLEADKHLVDSSGTSPFEEWAGIDYCQAFECDSNSVDWGSLESMAVVLDADVGVTDRLAVTGALAFIAPRYTGNLPDGPGDDGDFHGSIQDARIGARFVAVNEGPWAVTPFAAFVFPTTDYAVRGHTAPGFGLKELQVGATVGRLIDIGDSPRLWLQGAYYYAVMENVSEEIGLDRSNLILDLGYVFNKRLSANLQATWQKVGQVLIFLSNLRMVPRARLSCWFLRRAFGEELVSKFLDSPDCENIHPYAAPFTRCGQQDCEREFYRGLLGKEVRNDFRPTFEFSEGALE